MESVELDVIPINSSDEDEKEDSQPAVAMPSTPIEPIPTRSDEVAARRDDYQRQMANAYHRWQTGLRPEFEKQWQYVNAVHGMVISCWNDDYSQLRLRGVMMGARRRWRTALSDPRTMKYSEAVSKTFTVVDVHTKGTWTLPALFVRGLLDVDRRNGQMCFCTLERPHEYLSPAPDGSDAGIRLTVGVRLNSLGATSTDLTIVVLCNMDHCWLRTRLFFSYYTALEQLLAHIVSIQDIVSSEDKWRETYNKQ